MAIQGFSPPPPTPSPYYQLLERGSARLGRVKNTCPNKSTGGKIRDLNFDKKHAFLIFAHISHQGKQKQIHGKIPKSYQSIMKGFSTNRNI